MTSARSLLEDWLDDCLARSSGPDPIDTLLDEGGPWHVRGHLGAYLDRLRATDRGAWAEWLESRPAPVGRT